MLKAFSFEKSVTISHFDLLGEIWVIILYTGRDTCIL